MLRSVALIAALLIVSLDSAAEEQAFADAVAALAEGSFADKARVAERIARLAHPRAPVVLEALRAGDLHQRRSDGRVVIAERRGGTFELRDAVTGAALEPAGRRDLRRITTDNALRSALEVIIARGQLQADDARARLAAVRAMLDDSDSASIDVLRARFAEEPDPAVRDAIEMVLALDALRRGDASARLEAVTALGGRVDGSVRARLAALAADAAEPPELRDAAAAALAASERKLARYRSIETVFFGISMGSVLVLAAIGLAITFGVMGVINMAHGELIMLGAYITYVVQQLMPDAIGWSLAVAVPAAFLVSALAGIVIERGVIRFLYGRPLETLLATFGISLILQQAVRSAFSALNRPVLTPDWMSGSWQVVPGLSFTWSRLYILLFGLAVFAGLLLLLKHTRVGLEIRAVAQNREMARALGVRGPWVDALTFGLGAGVAGIAGVALSQLTNVGPNMGQAYIVDSFLVVVFGGVGNLWGTLVAGLSLGVVNKVLEPMTGAVLAKIVVLVLVILFIQRRPRGLFPPKGRMAET